MLALGVVAITACLLFFRKKNNLDNTPIGEEYDYVIVGGGSAGAVLANRLTGFDGDVRVLLLEAGTANRPMEVGIPAASPKLQRSAVDWQFKSEPQEHCRWLEGNVSNWPRGKMMGGCSSINYMAYVRGARADYEQFHEITGGHAHWAPNNIYAMFKRHENHQGIRDSKYHGTTGEVKVSFPTVKLDATTAFVEGFVEAGYKENKDYNGESIFGASPVQRNVGDGVRQDTHKCFIEPVVHKRPNLVVAAMAHVTRVLFDDKKHAAGVEYVRGDKPNGKRRSVRARKEVILCAGTVQSPQILMLSGVGPAAELKKHGIPVVADAPGVGQNMSDHLMYAVPVALRQPATAPLPPSITVPWATGMGALLTYATAKSGILTSNGLEGTFFHRTGVPNDAVPPHQPDLQIHQFSAKGDDDEAMLNLNIRRDWKTILTDMPETEAGSAFIVIALHPKSRGFIALRSADPFAAPIIEPRYMQHPDDVNVMVEGTKIVLETLKKGKRWKELKAELTRNKTGLKDVDGKFEPYTEDWLQEDVRNQTYTVYHPVGTVAVGADGSAPCDPEFRVRGVTGLRVVDCSSYPHLPSGNTNAPAMVLGEIAAQMIRGEVPHTSF